MNKAESVLLELIKKSIFNIPQKLPDSVDWNDVLNEAKAQTVVALVADAVPKENLAEWQMISLRSQAHYMRILYEQTNLCKLLNSNGITFAIIKGTAAAMYYPKPQFRTMGDIDFIVAQTDFDKTRELLENNDYIFCGDFGDDRDFTYQKGSVIFELHHRYSDERNDIEDILISGMENLQMHELKGHKFPTFSEDINGLIILDHIRHHLYGGLGIRQIVDYMIYLTYQTANGGLGDFLKLVKKVNLEKFCGILTKMCVMFLGMPNRYEWCMNSDSDTAEQLFDFIIKKGNFSRKNPYVYRPMSSLAQGVRTAGLFKVLQNAGLENWKAAKKHKFLRPFAFIYQIFRYVKRGVAALIHGENLKKDFKEGKKEADFYNRLGI